MRVRVTVMLKYKIRVRVGIKLRVGATIHVKRCKRSVLFCFPFNLCVAGHG